MYGWNNTNSRYFKNGIYAKWNVQEFEKLIAKVMKKSRK